jgi:hypothetical protein
MKNKILSFVERKMMYISACLKCYKNEEHGEIMDVHRKYGDGPMDGEGELCECGEPIYLVTTRNECGIADGDYSHTSASLAINPSQAAVHKKLFPGIGIKRDGQLHFDSVKKQSDYLKQTGFDKKPQKIRKKGKVIA